MPQITIYSTPTCPYCVMIKRYFDDKKINYEDIDVSQNTKEAQIMQQKSGQLGVPVLTIKVKNKEHVIVGFDKNKIDSLLDL